MPVNEDDDAFILHLSAHSNKFPDEQLLLPDGAPRPIEQHTKSRINRDTDLDQQSKKVPSVTSPSEIPIGSTVWHATKHNKQIAIVTARPTGKSPTQYTIRPLNSALC